MEKQIALLRGINISGKNKVPMPLLKAAFEDVGFLNVSTCINSGNVLFSSENNDSGDMAARCKAMMEERFMLDVPVDQAIFLIPPVTVREVYEAVGEAKPEYEQVGYYKNVIFWSAKRAALSKTRWYKIAGSSVNNKVTIRNASTVKKLLLLSNGRA